jgi:two-component system, chemotaxis family, protein-glutamate methylesterase/glutaminase
LALDKNISDRWHNSDILLLGGSAGSFKLLYHIVKILPPKLNKAVVIVMHRKKNYLSEVESLFAESARMRTVEITDKDKINKKTIYIVPANYHTLIEKDFSFALDVSEALWFSKPSIDITFDTAADAYQNKCTAVLFSGANQDGAEGLLKLRNAGSLTIAQHPEEAIMPEMPQAAIDINAADYVMRTDEIYELLKS